MIKKIRPYTSYIILSIIYIVLTMTLPVNTETLTSYHLSRAHYNELELAVILPLIAIWFAAFYGYIHLRHYAKQVEASPEGPGFMYIARGAHWLAWLLPVKSIVSSILTGIANANPGFLGASVIISNYISIIIVLVAFYKINKGCLRLVAATRVKQTFRSIQWLIIGFLIISVGFCYITLHRLSANHGANPYHLPVWLMLFTVLVPFLYAWLLGLFSAYNIGVFRKKVRGILYKRALGNLSFGIGFVIVTSITIQFLANAADSLSQFSLNNLLLIIYCLLIIYALAFVSIALGAKKLRKIEEV